MRFLQILRDWSEVWALLIPLSVIAVTKPKEKHIRLLVWYVILGFILNFTAIFMLEYYYLIPSWMYINNMVNNNLLYNIHSIIRVLFFSWYIITIRQYLFPILLKTLLTSYLVFVLINFIFNESPFFLSTRLFAAESIVLLIMCLFYFFSSIQDESQTNWLKHPSFLICAGISLYEVITFFIFLFFYPLSQKDQAFFLVTMRIYNITFVLLCILLALAFYQTKKNKEEK
jgi:hypothetical protein